MRKRTKKLVAIVGRPNVGKSTLFNMLVGTRKAIVDDSPGLTRDRNYAEVTTRDKSFIVVDTGGFEPTSDDVMLSQMRVQTMFAIEEADIIVFLGDGNSGISPGDYEIVRVLQRTDKNIFYVVNKIDSEKHEDMAVDFYSLGVERVFPVSALTGYGMGDFLDALLDEMPFEEVSSGTENCLSDLLVKVAVVGRPNVGKSTLINLLLGKQRLLANPEPGTTRDSIDTLVRREGYQYLFIDTAGIRRRSRITDRIEKYSTIKAFQSVNRADIVIMMMDATDPVTDQDARIAGYSFERGRAIILALNKWDLIAKDNKTIDSYVHRVRNSLKYLDYAPVITISATMGMRVPRLFKFIDELNIDFRRRISTADINKFLGKVVNENPPGMHRKSKRIKIYYGTQYRTGPPSFLFFCNYPESIHFSYKRFLANRLREVFQFGGSPLRVFFRKRQRQSPQNKLDGER